MKLKWKWCSFQKDRTIIWWTFRNKYFQLNIWHEFDFKLRKHTNETLPRIINI